MVPHQAPRVFLAPQAYLVRMELGELEGKLPTRQAPLNLQEARVAARRISPLVLAAADQVVRRQRVPRAETGVHKGLTAAVLAAAGVMEGVRGRLLEETIISVAQVETTSPRGAEQTR